MSATSSSKPGEGGLHKRSTGAASLLSEAQNQSSQDPITTSEHQVPLPQQEAYMQAGVSPLCMQRQQRAAAWMQRLQQAAARPGVLIPSPIACAVLLSGPLLAWAVSVTTGWAAFAGVRANKRDVQHPMLWFDIRVFRTLAGPALPFLVLLLRSLATWGATCSTASSAQTSSGGSYEGHATKTSTSQHDDYKGSGDKQPGVNVGLLNGSGHSSKVGPGRSAVRTTLAWQAGLVYCLVIAVRMVVYVVHLAIQRPVKEDMKPQAYMSDHLLLGASVAACLQVELICAVSDSLKLTASQTGLKGLCRELAAAGAVLLALLLECCVCLDMHYTARLYHEPSESWVAAVAGALLFQVPLAAWIARKWRQGSH